MVQDEEFDTTSVGTIVCERCGTLNLDSFRFCSQCGRLLTRREVAARKRAPHHVAALWERPLAEPARSEPLARQGQHSPPVPEQCLPGTPLEEEFKLKLGLVFWWGVRELAGAFDPHRLRQADGAPASAETVEMWTRGVHPLHAGVLVRLAGAHHQIDLLRGALLEPAEDPLKPLQLVEAFEQVLSDLSQATELMGREAFELLWRKRWKMPKGLRPHDPNMSLEEIRRTLEGNHHTPTASWIKEMGDELEPLRPAVAGPWRQQPALEQLGLGEVPAGGPRGLVLRRLAPAEGKTPRRTAPTLEAGRGQAQQPVDGFALGLLDFVIDRVERIYELLYLSEFDRCLQERGLRVDHTPPWDL